MKSFNLSILRKLVQLAAFLFLVYGSVIVGYYTADKLSVAFPALSCAFNFDTADYCTLIPVEHQLAHRFGPVVAAGGNIMMGLLPTLVTLGTFLLLFIVLNKAFCGWICPVGTFQEVLHLLGTKLGLRQRTNVTPGLRQRLRPVKWLILLFLVFIFPLLTGLGYFGHDMVDPFCKICPSRLMSSLFSGSTDQFHVDTATPAAMVLTISADFLFGLVIALSLTTRLPFCRICPMLALHAVFRKLGLLRLVKSGTDRCEKCGLCVKACPMDIAEIQTEMGKRDVTFEECTLCGRCVEFCPEQGALQLKYIGLPVFVSDPQYFKRRNQAQKQWQSKRDVP
jgi:ferredoxin-type protein NapH